MSRLKQLSSSTLNDECILFISPSPERRAHPINNQKSSASILRYTHLLLLSIFFTWVLWLNASETRLINIDIDREIEPARKSMVRETLELQTWR